MKDLLPGPGNYTYDPVKILKAQPKYGIGTAKRDQTLNQSNKYIIPAPSKYNPNFNVVLLHEAKWSFAQSQRPKLNGDRTPSVHDYKIKSKIGTEGPKFLIGQKLNEKPADKIPGPEYDPNYNTIKQKMPKYTLRKKF